MSSRSTPGESPREDGPEGPVPGEGAPPSKAAEPSLIASEDAFIAFYKESTPSLRAWLHKQYPQYLRDPRRTEGLIADAFDDLYEKRLTLPAGRDPFMALIDHLNNILSKERVRDMASLDSMGPSSRNQGSDLGSPPSHLGVPAPETRSQASVVGSREMNHKFSVDALMSLTQEQRDLYDLHWVQGRTLEEIAGDQGCRPQSVHDRWTTILEKLKKYMARLDSEVESPSREPLKTRDHARRAIDDLTNPARDLLRTVFVDGVAFEQAWRRLRFASKEEAGNYLEKGFEQLERKFGQKMPEALETALRRRKKEE